MKFKDFREDSNGNLLTFLYCY